MKDKRKEKILFKSEHLNKKDEVTSLREQIFDLQNNFLTPAMCSTLIKNLEILNNLNIELEDNEQETMLTIYQLDKIKKKLIEVASENPLDKKINISEEIANIELKDKNKVIRVRPMSYTPTDREEFEKQIKELLEMKLITPSKSPHSSPAFMVENEAERKRGYSKTELLQEVNT